MAKEKLFNDALRVAVLMEERNTGKTRLRLIADRLAEEAMQGNVAAIKEVAERIDGKVPQAVVGDDSEDPINIVAEIRRTIVRPSS